MQWSLSASSINVVMTSNVGTTNLTDMQIARKDNNKAS